MSKYLSRKFKFITLFAMIAVVFIHSYNYSDSFLTPTTTISEGANYFAMFEYFISNGLARFAVPLFSAISGYFFFRNFESIKKSYFKKVKSRFKSLLIPYCLWAFLSALFMFALSFIKIVCETDIIKERVSNGAYSLLSCFVNPPAFQLWYIQQLIIFTVLSPIIFLLVKYSKGYVVLLFAIPWLFDINFIINSEVLAFFAFGAWVGIFGKEKLFVKKDNSLITLIYVLIWVLLSAIITILALSNNSLLYIPRMLLYRANEIVGLIAVWRAFDHIFKRIINKKLVVLASNYIFFIYAMHEPLLHLAFQLGLLSHNSDVNHFVLFIFMPISVMAICTLAGMAVHKISKPAYSLLTGGRTYFYKIKQKKE